MPHKRIHSVRIPSQESSDKTTVHEQKQKITRKRLIIWSLIGCIVLVFVLFSRFGLITNISLRSESHALEDEVKSLRLHNDSLRKVIHKLTKDTLEIERIAREHYGLIKSGETVYIVEQK